jgi:predicted ribosomally synthesized peptide with SipW-like signal peptide
MSRKRVKQYLMLLMAIGVIAVVMSGSGTFASFTAEVANANNTFNTGTLYLHDSVNGSATECTSESAPNNSNVPASVGGANPGSPACGVLFTVASSQFAPNGQLNGSLAAGSISSIPVMGWDGLTSPGNLGLMFAIANGAEVKITQGANTDVCQASAAAAAAATTISVAGCTLTNSYTSGAIISSPGPFIAHLELRNAGSIDGSDLKFQLNGTSSTACAVTPGPSGATTLCSDLGFDVVETNNHYTAAISNTTGAITGAVGCAYGTSNGSGCTPATATVNLGNLAYRTGAGNGFDSLTLSSGGGTDNARDLTGVDSTLNHATGSGYTQSGAGAQSGGARYFLVEIWPGSLTNNDMGASTVFDLVWHMDQA